MNHPTRRGRNSSTALIAALTVAVIVLSVAVVVLGVMARRSFRKTPLQKPLYVRYVAPKQLHATHQTPDETPPPPPSPPPPYQP